MTKLSTDWIYIGVGIGAIYAIYKLTKPVLDTEKKASDIINGSLDLINTPVRLSQETVNTTEKFVKDALTAGSPVNVGITNVAKKISPLLTAAAKATAGLISSGSNKTTQAIIQPSIYKTTLPVSSYTDTTKTISAALGITPKATTSGGSVITATSPVLKPTTYSTTLNVKKYF